MVASMSTRRARVGVAAIGNRLYAVGGYVWRLLSGEGPMCTHRASPDRKRTPFLVTTGLQIWPP